MAEWLDFCVVHDPAAKTYIGVAKRDKSSGPHTFQFLMCGCMRVIQSTRLALAVKQFQGVDSLPCSTTFALIN